MPILFISLLSVCSTGELESPEITPVEAPKQQEEDRRDRVDLLILTGQACASASIGLFCHPVGVVVSSAAFLYGLSAGAPLLMLGAVGGAAVANGILLNILGGRDYFGKGAMLGTLIGSVLYIPFELVALGSIGIGAAGYILSQGHVQYEFLAVGAGSMAIGASLFVMSSLFGYYYLE